MDLHLANRTVLVTGSYRGTGLVIARSFLAEGAKVYVHAFTVDQAEAAVAEIGGTPVSGDICTDEGAAAVAEQVGTTPDVLVNNYGHGGQRRVGRGATAEDWREMYEANVLSAQRLTRPVPTRDEAPGVRADHQPGDRGVAGTGFPATRTTMRPRQRWWP